VSRGRTARIASASRTTTDPMATAMRTPLFLVLLTRPS
jgi:hypothetical protein